MVNRVRPGFNPDRGVTSFLSAVPLKYIRAREDGLSFWKLGKGSKLSYVLNFMDNSTAAFLNCEHHTNRTPRHSIHVTSSESGEGGARGLDSPGTDRGQTRAPTGDIGGGGGVLVENVCS